MTKTPKQRVLEVLEKMIPDDARDVKFTVSFEAKQLGADPNSMIQEHVLQEVSVSPAEYILTIGGEAVFYDHRKMELRGGA